MALRRSPVFDQVFQNIFGLIFSVDRRGTCRPFHSRVSNVSNWYSPLMSMTLKLQTDVTSPIYPSFLIFFASMPPISPSTFFASIVDKIFPPKIQFSWRHHASLIFTIMQTTPTHTYSKLGYIIAQHMEIACVHRSINRSINSRLLENWFCLAFFASIVDKKIPKKFQFSWRHTSLLFMMVIIIHDYANHAYSYIFIIMQIRPDPWPPQSDPWPLWIFIDFIDRLRHIHCLKNQ